jgi:isoleucyl-tRNA synthetase
LAQDAKGRKMSKSLGNVVEANKLLEKNSADLSRFYMLRKCSPIDFMNFDVNELDRRTYQILSTLYHLNRFFVQNAEFDGFKPDRNTLEWARHAGQVKKVDSWLVSKLQSAIGAYTAKLEKSEFNLALSILEEFVIEELSRLYVPMVRKELWTDDPQTLDRRLAVYATLWHALRTATLLFNPVTPYISEALHQRVFRKLNPTLPESVNLEQWPEPDDTLRDKKLEETFQTLFVTVSLVYSARQNARLKRRWPLNKMVVVGSEELNKSLKDVHELFLELANVKTVEYAEHAPAEAAEGKWVSASENGTQVFLDVRRDERLLGEGLMRDLARRVQALRKELGYMPTDVLEQVQISELDEESVRLLEPYLEEMKDLVRAETVYLYIGHPEAKGDWHESRLDDKKIYISIPTKT